MLEGMLNIMLLKGVMDRAVMALASSSNLLKNKTDSVINNVV